MPTTETFTSSVTDLRFHHSILRLSKGDGQARKVRSIDRKRVYATIVTEDDYSEQVRLDQPLVWERDVPTAEELEADRVAARLDHIKRFIARAKASYDGACGRIAEKRESGAHTMTSFDLDGLLEATAKGTVAARVEHASILPEGLTDEQRVERVNKMCDEILYSFWGSPSTSNASNQLDVREMAAWAELARDVRRGW